MSLNEIYRKANEKEVRIWLESMCYRMESTAQAIIEKVKAKKIANKLRK